MIGTIDTIIVVIYLILVLCIGYYAGKGSKSSDDYLNAKKSMHWFAVMLSVTATMISANAMIGGPGWAYTDGIIVFMVNFSVPIAILFTILITAPLMYRLNLTSIYEYVDMRFGSRSKVLCVIQFFINSLIQVSSMVFIPCLFINVITGWSYLLIVPIIVIVSLIYTLMGGIKAVIYTDMIQTIILCGSVCFCMFFIIKNTGLGILEPLYLAAESQKMEMLDFSLQLNRANGFWAAFLGGSILWIRYFSFDQVQVQRIITSKNLGQAIKSLSLSAILMNVIYFVMLLMGVYLWAFYDGRSFSNSNDIMIDFIITYLPTGVVGLLIAAIFAAAMSSIDSILNSMTTVIVTDVMKKNDISKKSTLVISSILGILIAVIVIFGFSGSVKNVLDIVGQYISYFSGPICAIFIIGLFSLSIDDKTMFWGVIFGFFLNILFIANVEMFWLWYPFFGFIFTLIMTYLGYFIFDRTKLPDTKKCYSVRSESILVNMQVYKENKKYVLLTTGFLVVQSVVALVATFVI